MDYPTQMEDLTTCDGCGGTCRNASGFCQNCQTPDYRR